MMHEIEKALAGVTPEVYESLKLSIAKGRWPSGDLLTKTQKEHSIQLVIGYEAQYVEESERLGAMPVSDCKSS